MKGSQNDKFPASYNWEKMSDRFSKIHKSPDIEFLGLHKSSKTILNTLIVCTSILAHLFTKKTNKRLI